MLDEVLQKVQFPTDEHTLVGTQSSDDAAVYRLTDDVALVQTVDFFTPIVDDPYIFGQIAAANALSDIYAMGARPFIALNIIGFPQATQKAELLTQILQGGADKVREADTTLLGGHSIQDKELKYGLAVTGIVHPEKVITNNRVREGDVLLLTKPIGTGMISTALKNGKATTAEVEAIVESMLLLNRLPSEKMIDYDVSACTDITGFGLLGHLWEMIRRQPVQAHIQVKSIPVFDKALHYARNAIFIPGGTLSNIRFVEKQIQLRGVEEWYLNLLLDPQTSGGLLIALPEAAAEQFIRDLKDKYPYPVRKIGRLAEGENKIIIEE